MLKQNENNDFLENEVFSRKILRLVIEQRPITLSLTIIIFIIALSIAYRGEFLSSSNFKAIFDNIGYDVILACGTTILLVAGQIDLSIGSTLSFVGVMTAFAMKNMGMNFILAIIFGLAIAALIGLFNGTIIAVIGVNPMIATIATLGSLAGLSIVVTGTGIGSISDLPLIFGRIGQSKIFGFQSIFWIMVIVLIMIQYLLSKTKFFRQCYYIGNNPIASQFSGVKVVRVKLIIYVLSSVLAGFVGILFASRNGAAAAAIGNGAELRVITAVILGGASLSGGKGTIIGSFLGVIFMALISTALTIAKVPTFWYSIVTSAILLIAIVADVAVSRRRI